MRVDVATTAPVASPEYTRSLSSEIQSACTCAVPVPVPTPVLEAEPPLAPVDKGSAMGAAGAVWLRRTCFGVGAGGAGMLVYALRVAWWCVRCWRTLQPGGSAEGLADSEAQRNVVVLMVGCSKGPSYSMIDIC